MRESFGVHTVGPGGLEGLHSPRHGVLHGKRSRNAAADLIGQTLKIRFQWRRLKRRLNHSIGFARISRRVDREAEDAENARPEQASHSSHRWVH